MKNLNVLEKMHSAGLRATPQRIAICDLLMSSDQHPTANDIFDRLKPDFPSLSLATVYNTLDTLVGVGLVNAIGSIGDDRVHFDGNLSPHINLACTKCQKIIDTHSDCVDELDAEIIKNSGFEINGSRILYFGTCPDCLRKQT